MFTFIGPESLFVSLALLIAFIYPQLGAGWFDRAERTLRAVARRRKTSLMICGLAALAIRAALLPFVPVPAPYVNNEFSHLLAADTFLSGRLANPPHPMWVHFESFHVIFQPTYASMYPPVQGLILAAGSIIGGGPFLGGGLRGGVVCGPERWMLPTRLPPGGGFFCGPLPVFRFAFFRSLDRNS